MATTDRTAYAARHRSTTPPPSARLAAVCVFANARHDGGLFVAFADAATLNGVGVTFDADGVQALREATS